MVIFGPVVALLDFAGGSMFLIEGVLGSKNLFRKSCSQRPYYYGEVISVFRFGGSKTRLPSPKGGRQMKSCSDQKAYLAKVDRSAHITKGVIWFF